MGPMQIGLQILKDMLGSSWLTNWRFTAFHSKVFLRIWNTFSCENKGVSGVLVLQPSLYLTLAEVGLCVSGGFFLFLWINATSALRSRFESADLGIRLWKKLLLGDNSLPSGHSKPVSGSSLPLFKAPCSVGWEDWVSLPTDSGSKGWHNSESSSPGLSEASRPKRSWLRRCP